MQVDLSVDSEFKRLKRSQALQIRRKHTVPSFSEVRNHTLEPVGSSGGSAIWGNEVVNVGCA